MAQGDPTRRRAIKAVGLALAVVASWTSAVAHAGVVDQVQDVTVDQAGVYGNPAAATPPPQSDAQTFTAGLSGVLDRVDLHLERDPAATQDLVVQLRDTTGAGLPGSNVLSQVGLPAASVPEGTRAFVPVRLAALVTAGTRYALVVYAQGTARYGWSLANNDAYAAGERYFVAASPPTGAFTAATGDLAFRTYVQVQGIERFTTAGCSTWAVPDGVTSVRAWAVGARGETAGVGVSDAGRGDSIAATIGGLRGGDALRICVASGGGQAPGAHDGGGASGVARGSDFAVPALIAGGGGSAGGSAAFGGDAGLPSGGTGYGGFGPQEAGKGGTQTAGGAGGAWMGDVAESGTATDASGPGRGGGAGAVDGHGGGGGGYFGGGAGVLYVSGGGGGSSFCAAVAPVSECTHYGVQGTLYEPGIGFGAPQVTLLYTVLDAPRVEVAAPAPGAEYALREVVATSFSCIEAANGPGIASCADQAGRVSGAALDTSAPGPKTLAVTAVSLAGRRFTREVAYTVRAAAAPPPPAPPLAASKSPLRLTGLSQSSARWYRSGRSRRGHTVGTTLRFALSRRARVTFSFVRRTPGRRSGGRCVRETRRLIRAPRCTRNLAAGTLRRTAPGGRTTLRFTGLLSNGKRLAPGLYRVTVRARDAAGASNSARLTFRILG